MVTQKLAHCDLDYSTLVKNTPHLCALGPFHSDLASVLFNQILEADSQEGESQVACNPLLKTAESKTRRFVEFLREQSSSKGRTWGCSTTQGCNATEVAPWDHHLLGHRESFPSSYPVSVSLQGPHCVGARPRVNPGFLTRASAVARKRPSGQPCHGPFRSYKKACNYIWVGFK